MHYHPLVRRVAEGLRRRCGVRQGADVLVAVSGGADSVALLRAMALLAPRRGWRLRLEVAHVQHHLRGEDAEADAAFVRDLAAGLGLPYHRRDLSWHGQRGNVEDNARRMRYAALLEIAVACSEDSASAGEGGGARFVATAHHADDQLETLLLRLVRGTGLRGLRGIAWRRELGSEGVMLIRPMLAATREQAVDFLRAMAQPWREDASNQDTQRARARLRREVLPVLRDMRPGVATRAVRLADRVRAAVEALEPQMNADGHG